MNVDDYREHHGKDLVVVFFSSLSHTQQVRMVLFVVGETLLNGFWGACCRK